MAKKNYRIILRNSDIANIENCSPRTAAQRMNDMKIYYKKPEKRTKITFIEYSKYLEIPIEEFAPFR